MTTTPSTHPAKHPVVFAEVLFDCFEDGSRVLGGAPFNVAWHLQAFGRNPLMISRVGNDPMGDEIARKMEGWGMRRDGLQRDPVHATGEVRIRLTNGQPDFTIADPRAYDFIEPLAGVELSPSLLYHGSLALRHETCRKTLAILQQEHPAPVFMDVNLRRSWWDPAAVHDLLSRCRWVKINEDELKTLSADASGGVTQMAERMLERHALGAIVVTLGERGAFVLDAEGGKVDVAPAGRLEVVDAVGAGDAFASVCILGIEQDWPWNATLERAQQFASRLVVQRGAVIEDAAVYRAFLDQWT